ncbi:recombinase family protein [Streptomyces sp. UP1A-1]|nr:recombinase family protein [Streptomyces sp. UP1A-1]
MPEQAEMISDAYNAYVRGTTGFNKLAARWNELGLRTARGSVWLDQSVRLYLDAGFPAGLLHVHNPEAVCGEPGKCRKMSHYTYAGAEHDAVIDDDVWDNYRDMRATRRVTPRRSLSPVYPLSGLIWCGYCGSRANTATGRQGPGTAYRCQVRSRRGVDHDPVWFPRTELEGHVYEWLLEVRDEIDAIAAGRVVTPPKPKGPDPESVRKRLTKEIERCTAAIDRAFDAYTLGDADRETYLRARAKHEKTRAKAQEELDALLQQDTRPTDPTPFRETILGLIDEWDTISVASKRVLLARLIARVQVWQGRRYEIIPVWTEKSIIDALPVWSARNAS